LAERFNYYDAIANLIPGAIGCLFFVYTFDLLGITMPKLDVGSLGAAGIGIAVAYTVGHLLQSLASSFEPVYFLLWGGRPSGRLFGSRSREFSEAQLRQLSSELKTFFNIKEECPEDRKLAQNFRQRLFDRCAALCNRNKLGRVDVFNAVYGFHRVLLTTFLLALVTYLTIWFMQNYGALNISPEKAPTLRLLILLTGIGFGIEFFRARKRAYYCATEVLWMTSEYIRAAGSSTSKLPDASNGSPE
jgi:hypothetical protein